jgi:hypothetical protein
MPSKGACFYGDPLPGGTNPHYWVVLCLTERYVVMVSLTTPRGKLFAHRVKPSDFPCLQYDSNVCWERANSFVPEIPFSLLLLPLGNHRLKATSACPLDATFPNRKLINLTKTPQ